MCFSTKQEVPEYGSGEVEGAVPDQSEHDEGTAESLAMWHRVNVTPAESIVWLGREKKKAAFTFISTLTSFEKMWPPTIALIVNNLMDCIR
jgi:hypothetical protein